jgi:hypothetical protein
VGKFANTSGTRVARSIKLWLLDLNCKVNQSNHQNHQTKESKYEIASENQTALNVTILRQTVNKYVENLTYTWNVEAWLILKQEVHSVCQTLKQSSKHNWSKIL